MNTRAPNTDTRSAHQCASLTYLVGFFKHASAEAATLNDHKLPRHRYIILGNIAFLVMVSVFLLFTASPLTRSPARPRAARLPARSLAPSPARLRPRYYRKAYYVCNLLAQTWLGGILNVPQWLILFASWFKPPLQQDSRGSPLCDEQHYCGRAKLRGIGACIVSVKSALQGSLGLLRVSMEVPWGFQVIPWGFHHSSP